MISDNCLTTETKRAFLADELSTERRETAEVHLSDCSACRRQISIMLSEIKTEETLPLPESLKQKAKQIPLRQTSEKQNFFTTFLAFFQKPAAVAAGVVLLIALASIAFIALREKNPLQKDEKFRQGNSSANKPQLLSPISDSSIETTKIDFRWSKVINALSYTVVVLDEKGDILFQKSTTQESLSMDAAALNLANSRHFFWFVRVKLADGTTSNSDSSKFSLQKKF